MRIETELIKVGMICPFNSGPFRGNMTTVRRIAEQLPKSGCQGTLIGLDTTGSDQCFKILQEMRPALLHAFHAFHSGTKARTFSHELKIPYIITITGSDIFEDKFSSDPKTALAILDSDAVTCFDHLVAKKLQTTFPKAADKTVVIPQGVALLPVNRIYDNHENRFQILLPAALRPVKGVTLAISALAQLAQEMPSLRLLVAGGTLDQDYAAEVAQAAAPYPWVKLLGDIPYGDMGNYYAASDLILNSSLFEGGMANTLLEAMAMGKPVVARDILGNRSVVRHGVTGWLFNDDSQLIDIVRMLVAEPKTGIKAGEAGRKFVLENCSPEKEAANYVRLYRQLIFNQ